MVRKIVTLVFTFAFLAGFTAAADTDYTHNQKLYFGDQVELNDYVFEYRASNSGEQMFRVGEWTGTSFHVIKELEGMDVYNSKGEKIEVNENISLVIDETGYDRDGRFIRLDILGSKDVFSSGEMTTSAPDRIIISRGESADVPLTLENTGFLNQTYNLRSETNSSLTTSFSFQNYNVTEVYVSAGEQEDVTAKVRVPEEAQIGTYTINLVAENYTTFSENIQVEVKGAEKDRSMALDAEQIYQEIRPGESSEFYVSVDNRGEAKLNNVNVTVTPPNGWSYELEDGFKEEVRGRYGHMRSRITLEAPQDVKPGDYIMEVSAESQRATIDEPEEISVHVREKSGLAYIGVVLMAISILILVVVYRKFQRR